jgi:hypothetical protein
MAAGPLTPAGVKLITIDVGLVLTVTGQAGAQAVSAILGAGGMADVVDTITNTQSKTYGPYTVAKTCRLSVGAGQVGYSTSAALSAIPQLQAVAVSQDGLTVSSQGVKPGSNVVVYNADTGAPVGTATALADGSWSVGPLKTPLLNGVRVAYEATIVGPVSTVSGVTPPLAAPGQVTGLALDAATATTQALHWTAPATGGAPASYRVEYRVAGTTSWSILGGTTAGTSATVTGLTAQTSYQYRVTAVNATGSGTPSVTVTGATAAASSGSQPGTISTDASDPNSITPKV